MATIRQIAHAARVSPMTVSFVLNNKPGQVSEETRERVLQVVREMGYKPRASAERPDSEEHVNTLGIVSGMTRPFFSTSNFYTMLLDGLLSSADEQRQNITLFTSSLFHEDPRQSIRTYCDGRTDGLLVIASGPENQLVPALVERGIPCVLMGDRDDTENVSSVDVDNAGGMYAMTAWVISQGHRRIAFHGFPGRYVHSAQERQEGYCAALQDAGLPLRPDYILDDVWKDESIYERLGALARMPEKERPTALVCWNDGFAMRALMVLRDAGLRVPEDISVTGFDNEAITASTHPPLTTIQQPYKELGAQAIALLRRQIAQRPAERTAEQIRLPGQLLIRSSVATLREAFPAAVPSVPAIPAIRPFASQTRKEVLLVGSPP